jgi:hypothetical protein
MQNLTRQLQISLEADMFPNISCVVHLVLFYFEVEGILIHTSSSHLEYLLDHFSTSNWVINVSVFSYLSFKIGLCNMCQQTTTCGRKKICKLLFNINFQIIIFKIPKKFTPFLPQNNCQLNKGSRIICRTPTCLWSTVN